MKNGTSAGEKRLLFAQRIYFVWIFLSMLISAFYNKDIASLYFDLPVCLKNLPRFVISEAYLIFFVPALTVAITGGIAGIIFVGVQNKNIFNGRFLLKTRGVFGGSKKP